MKKISIGRNRMLRVEAILPCWTLQPKDMTAMSMRNAIGWTVRDLTPKLRSSFFLSVETRRITARDSGNASSTGIVEPTMNR